MKIIFTFILIVLIGCSEEDNISKNITTMMSQTVSANTRVGACTRLADFNETRVIKSLVNSLDDVVVKGCATRTLIIINSPESLSSLLEFIEQSDFDSTIFSMAIRFGSGKFLSNIKEVLIDVKSRSNTTANEVEEIDKLMKELTAKEV